MNTTSLITFIASLWHISPVRWAVYATVALWLLFVYVMRLRRIRNGEGLSLIQKVVGYPVAVVAVLLDWAYNWTIGTLLWSPRFYRLEFDWPHSWKELVTQRLQRTLDHPDEYGGYRLTIARFLKPHLNRHDKGHLE